MYERSMSIINLYSDWNWHWTLASAFNQVSSPKWSMQFWMSDLTPLHCVLNWKVFYINWWKIVVYIYSNTQTSRVWVSIYLLKVSQFQWHALDNTAQDVSVILSLFWILSLLYFCHNANADIAVIRWMFGMKFMEKLYYVELIGWKLGHLKFCH